MAEVNDNGLSVDLKNKKASANGPMAMLMVCVLIIVGMGYYIVEHQFIGIHDAHAKIFAIEDRQTRQIARLLNVLARFVRVQEKRNGIIPPPEDGDEAY